MIVFEDKPCLHTYESQYSNMLVCYSDDYVAFHSSSSHCIYTMYCPGINSLLKSPLPELISKEEKMDSAVVNELLLSMAVDDLIRLRKEGIV